MLLTGKRIGVAVKPFAISFVENASVRGFGGFILKVWFRKRSPSSLTGFGSCTPRTGRGW